MNMTQIKKKNVIVLMITVVVLVTASISIYIYLYGGTTSTLMRKVTSEQDDTRTFEVPSSPEGFGNEPDDTDNLNINPSYSCGVRFINISIPQGAIITDAYVKLFSIGLPNRNDHVNCTIYADNVDNADDFYKKISANNDTKGCLDRCGRIYTQHYVLWDAITPFQQWVTTPDLKEILQEIINRPGWQENNSIALLFITRHSQDAAVFNNFNLGNAAELFIEYKTS